MDSNNITTDDISINVREEETDIEKKISITEVTLKTIVNQFISFDTISLCFLFFDDADLSLKLIQQCSCNKNLNVLLKHLLQEKLSRNWKLKLLECFFHLKQYFVLESLGLNKYDAQVAFNEKSYILPGRLNLFRICDSLTEEQSSRIMHSVDSLENEEFLELFFLKLNQPKQWALVNQELGKLKNSIDLCVKNVKELSDSFVTCSLESNVEECSNKEEIVNLIADDNVYPIKDPNNIGLCLIINIMEFMSLEKRYGSEKDVEMLESTFKSLNFTVKTVSNNVPSKFFGEQLFKIIHTHFEKNHSVFIMAILSHGNKGHIYCSDEKLVSIKNQIMKILSKIYLLQNIPKVLIIQACQGEKYLISKNIRTDGPSDSPLYDVSEKQSIQKPILDEYISDILIAMSTVPGFRSFRERNKGSFFIQKLCSCLKNHPNWSMLDVLTETIKHVVSEVVPTKQPNLSVGQQPQLKSLLSRRLYLKPITSLNMTTGF